MHERAKAAGVPFKSDFVFTEKQSRHSKQKLADFEKNPKLQPDPTLVHTCACTYTCHLNLKNIVALVNSCGLQTASD